MGISSVGFNSFDIYPQQVTEEALMTQITTFMGQLNESHEQSKEATDEINQETYS